MRPYLMRLDDALILCCKSKKLFVTPSDIFRLDDRSFIPSSYLRENL